jgi:ComF family protein
VSYFLGTLTEHLDEVLDILFQTTCLCCERWAGANGFCDNCRPMIPIQGPLCLRCGEELPETQSTCGLCEGGRLSAFRRVRSLLWLGTDAKCLIHKIKYGRRFELLSLFRNVIKEDFAPFYSGSPVVLPVPLYPSKFLSRGFNPAEVLAGWLSRRENLRTSSRLLVKVKETVPQSSLKKKARSKNLKGVFKLNETPPSSVLLVDDIFTTGATLEACARVLSKSGVEEIYGWTLFRTPARWQ